MKYLVVTVFLFLLFGCSSNGLVRGLYDAGAKPSTTAKLVFGGSDSDWGRDTRVVITDKKIIGQVWHSILNSKNYGRHSACGARTIEFYHDVDSHTPVATLKVECGDVDDGVAYLAGTGPYPWNARKRGRDGLYQCRDLDGFVMKYLKQEYITRTKIR